jgi:hypothetical protein
MNPSSLDLQPPRGASPVSTSVATGRYLVVEGETCYRISNVQTMAPFFVSLVSSSDHWAFIASNGAVSMGRRNPSNSLFPYYSADKLIDLVASSGPRTILKIARSGAGPLFWTPFADSLERTSHQRNLYKNVSGSKIFFEEVHAETGLCFRYCWETSNRFGFVRSCSLQNTGESLQRVEILDGLQNILPYGVGEAFQLRFSNLIDAYKKSELLAKQQLGIYYLSSIPTDLAEPSEGLRATVVWNYGLKQPKILLSQRQLRDFYQGTTLEPELDLRGQRGCYFVNSPLNLEPEQTRRWGLVADLAYDQTEISDLLPLLNDEQRESLVREDIALGEVELTRVVAGSDGIQLGENRLRTHRHRSNVTFNVMRGGTPQHGYQLDWNDFRDHLRNCNRKVWERNQSFLGAATGSSISRDWLIELARRTGDLDLLRICLEYLPLRLGRRHGDPTRPWNAFSIELKNEDGSSRVYYEGNWRDIFQNWEALGCSYPGLLTGMVLRFLNASTADGYNPYRLNKEGFDWEHPDPADPWANIGYWGDHQIAYLDKLLDWAYRFVPDQLLELLNQPVGVYANVPYRIGTYQRILDNPEKTIDYDFAAADQIQQRIGKLGWDGRLLHDTDGRIYRVILMEKLLLPSLVKLANFVPQAGIWLNTQRPEWNDANNALVGKGASLVTVCYLRRHLSLLQSLVAQQPQERFPISREVAVLFRQVAEILSRHPPESGDANSSERRRQIVDLLQTAGSQYRQALYQGGLSGPDSITRREFLDFMRDALNHLDRTIDANERPDGLFHSYNLLRFAAAVQPAQSPQSNHCSADESATAATLRKNPEGGLDVETMYEMLEGQVAVLNSRRLTPERVASLLVALRNSKLYREDLGSYLLYPDRELPRFLEKNVLPPALAKQQPLIRALLQAGIPQVVRQDREGNLHFNGNLRNADDLAAALQRIAERYPQLAPLIQQESGNLQELFRSTFQHQYFTGRSGTFFAYEGLGSVYWHMVSKLLLAVGDCYVAGKEGQTGSEVLQELREAYRDIREGLGLSSLPGRYGAFPIDPYSHTPKHCGAQQPGMTGQTKEDMLTRSLELGVQVNAGILAFHPWLFETSELLSQPASFQSFDVGGQPIEWQIERGRFVFTCCQVPVIYYVDPENQNPGLRIYLQGQTQPVERAGNSLTLEESQSIFNRSGQIARIEFRLGQLT